MNKFALILVAIVGLYLASLVYLALSVARFTNYWKEQITKPAPKNALVYVALGDSAAQGVGAFRATDGYVGQFAKRLEAKHKRPVRIVNLSVSGARVKDVTDSQLPQLKGYKPDIITLDIGGNDIAQFDAQTFKTDFTELVSKLPAGTIVADVPYFGGRTQLPFFGGGLAEQSVLVANTIIAEATRGTSLKVVPMHDVTKTRNGRRLWNYAPDYFHPSNLGYKAWTDAFWDAYEQQ